MLHTKIILNTNMYRVPVKHHLRVTLKNTESKYLAPTQKEDPVLPARFVSHGQ